jgi:hypothetical protein
MPVNRITHVRAIGQTGAAGTPAPAKFAPVRTLAPAPVEAPRTDAATRRPTDAGRDSSVGWELNESISGAQLAMQFLDRLGGELSSLRDGISRYLRQPEPRAPHPAAIGEQMQRVTACWLERQSASAGTLNSHLEYGPMGAARQHFTVRGLDFDLLRAGRAEILNFSIGGRGHGAGSSVSVGPDLSNAVLVHRFDRALAPCGIRAAHSAEGALTFSVLETAWPSIRDTFTVLGEGRRFSTGRFNRVRIAPLAPLIQPEEWSSGDIAALRSMRAEVFKAQGLVRQARQVVARELAGAAAYLQAEVEAKGDQAASAAGWFVEFTASFVASAGRADYLASASFTPALSAIDRQRVLTVLAR